MVKFQPGDKVYIKTNSNHSEIPNFSLSNPEMRFVLLGQKYYGLGTIVKNNLDEDWFFPSINTPLEDLIHYQLDFEDYEGVEDIQGWWWDPRWLVKADGYSKERIDI